MNFKAKLQGYKKTFSKYGINPKALQWASKQSAETRYKELVKDIDFEGKTVLDVGCGFGDILPHIKAKTKRFEYMGIDLVPEFIRVAKSRYPKHKFKQADYLSANYKGKFDIILTSGTLNANIKKPLIYRYRFIKKMFSDANYAVAFNMAGNHPQPENKVTNKVYYADSEKVVKFCLELCSKVIFRHNYHPKDFTIVIFK